MINNFVSDTDYFTLDGESSNSLGLFCDYISPSSMAEQRYTDSNVGEDEQVTTPDDVYSNIVFRINFFTFRNENYNDAAIKAFCANKKRLTLSRFPDTYFKIRKISLTAEDTLKYAERIDYTLTLTLAPFRYSTDNEWTSLVAGDDIYNDYTRYSKPLFEIKGTGNITLTVNGSTFTVNGLNSNQTVYIDSERHITYSGSTLFIGKTDGQYPLLNVGRNSVAWTGTVATVRFKGNWRDY